VLQGRKLAQMSVPLFPPEKIYLGVSLKENDRFGLFGLVKGANKYKRDKKANIDRQREIDRQIDTTQMDRKKDSPTDFQNFNVDPDIRQTGFVFGAQGRAGGS
jgi:hypothetical protein